MDGRRVVLTGLVVSAELTTVNQIFTEASLPGPPSQVAEPQ